MAAKTPSESRFAFMREIHPFIREHHKLKPVKVRDLHQPNLNGKIAIALTNGVGTMWCAYAFAALALVALPGAISGGLLTMVMWVSQTFIQLVMLSVIMVGQNILGAASDDRAERTYNDAEAIFHESNQIQQHLDLQDQHLASQDARLEAIILAMKSAYPNLAAELDAGNATP